MPKYKVKIAPPTETFKVEAETKEQAKALAEDHYIENYAHDDYIEVMEIISPT